MYVYLMASKPNGVLYAGVTRDPRKRAWEHKNGIGSAFTKRYFVQRLVWLREFDTPLEAIAFEKKLKRWPRAQKIELIKEVNPNWDDLYETLNH